MDGRDFSFSFVGWSLYNFWLSGCLLGVYPHSPKFSFCFYRNIHPLRPESTLGGYWNTFLFNIILRTYYVLMWQQQNYYCGVLMALVSIFGIYGCETYITYAYSGNTRHGNINLFTCFQYKYYYLFNIFNTLAFYI